MQNAPNAKRRSRAGFTLPDVMITLCIVALISLGVFGGLQVMSKLSLATAIRSEAHRLLQAEAERLTSVEFTSFAASGNQTITGNFKTTFLPGSEAQFSYPPSGATGRVAFTRRVVETASTATSRSLRVEVQWTWQGQTSLISVPLFRSR